MLYQQRQTVIQPFTHTLLTVAVTPTPLDSNQNAQTSYIDSFLVCLFSTAANSVFLGDNTVTLTNGMEIPPGVTIQLSITNERPKYEVQYPVLDVAQALTCQRQEPVQIPFIYWDLSQLYLIAAAPTNVIVVPFRRPYV
jgi:hypothetical protein